MTSGTRTWNPKYDRLNIVTSGFGRLPKFVPNLTIFLISHRGFFRVELPGEDGCNDGVEDVVKGVIPQLLHCRCHRHNGDLSPWPWHNGTHHSNGNPFLGTATIWVDGFGSLLHVEKTKKPIGWSCGGSSSLAEKMRSGAQWPFRTHICVLRKFPYHRHQPLTPPHLKFGTLAINTSVAQIRGDPCQLVMRLWHCQRVLKIEWHIWF